MAAEHLQAVKFRRARCLFAGVWRQCPELALRFWVDLLVQSNRMRLVSDIRLRIEEPFMDNGIVIAFPQRNVQLDLAQPVKVDLASGISQTVSAA